jgi:hypothetical protein
MVKNAPYSIFNQNSQTSTEWKEKNTLTQIGNQMIVPCSLLDQMVVSDDATNNFYVNTLRTRCLHRV